MPDHLPRCPALRCKVCRRIEGEVHIPVSQNAGGYREDEHDYQPGLCNCELGRLRAENEKLRNWQRRAVWLINQSSKQQTKRFISRMSSQSKREILEAEANWLLSETGQTDEDS